MKAGTKTPKTKKAAKATAKSPKASKASLSIMTAEMKAAAKRQLFPDAEKPAAAKSATKKDTVLGLLRQPGGATLTVLAAATAWERSFVQGFISSKLRGEQGLKPESFKNKEGERCYKLAK